MTPRQARVPARLAQDAAYPPATTALAEFLPDERLRALVPSAARLPNDEAFLGTLRPSPFDDFVFPRRQISNRLVDGWCSIPITPLATWFQESPPRSTQPRGRPEFEPWGLFPLAQLSTVSDAFFQRSASTRQQRASEDSTLPPFLRGALDDVPTRAAKLAGQRLVDGWWSVPITALATWFQESPPRSTQPRGKPEFEPWGLFPLAQLSTVSDAFAPRPASPRQQKPFEDSTLSPFLRGVLDDVLARAARLNSQRLLDGWWLQAATTQVTSTVDNGLLVPRQQSSARTFVEPALANLLTGSLCNQLVVPTRPQSRQQLEGWHFQALTALAPWFQESPPRSFQPRGRPEFEPWGLFPLAQLSTVSDAFVPRPALPHQQRPFVDFVPSSFLPGALEDASPRATLTRLRQQLDGWYLQTLTALAPWFQESPSRSTQPRGKPEFEPWGLFPLAQLSTFSDAFVPRPAPPRQQRLLVDFVPSPFLSAVLENVSPSAALIRSRQQLDGWYLQALTALEPWFQESPPRSTQPRGKPEFEPWGLFPLAQLSSVSDSFVPRSAAPRAQQLVEDLPLTPFLHGVVDDTLIRTPAGVLHRAQTETALLALTPLATWFQESPARSTQPRGKPEFEPWGLFPLAQLSTALDAFSPRPALLRRVQISDELASTLLLRGGAVDDALVRAARAQSPQQLDGWYLQELTTSEYLTDDDTVPRTVQLVSRQPTDGWYLQALTEQFFGNALEDTVVRSVQIFLPRPIDAWHLPPLVETNPVAKFGPGWMGENALAWQLDRSQFVDDVEAVEAIVDEVMAEVAAAVPLELSGEYFPPRSEEAQKRRSKEARPEQEPPRIVRNIVYNFNSDVAPTSRRRFVAFLEDARKSELHFDAGEAFVMKLPAREYGKVASWRGSSVLQVKPEEIDVLKAVADLASPHGLVIIAYDEDQIFLGDADSKKEPPPSRAPWFIAGTVVGLSIAAPPVGLVVGGIAAGVWAWNKIFGRGVPGRDGLDDAWEDGEEGRKEDEEDDDDWTW